MKLVIFMQSLWNTALTSKCLANICHHFQCHIKQSRAHYSLVPQGTGGKWEPEGRAS